MEQKISLPAIWDVTVMDKILLKDIPFHQFRLDRLLTFNWMFVYSSHYCVHLDSRFGNKSSLIKLLIVCTWGLDAMLFHPNVQITSILCLWCTEQNTAICAYYYWYVYVIPVNNEPMVSRHSFNLRYRLTHWWLNTKRFLGDTVVIFH